MTSAVHAPSPLRVGVVGLGWMGQVHARAYTRVGQHYLDAPLRPVLVAVADNAGDARLARTVAAYGFTDVHADWRELVARDDIDVVSITGPNFIHRDVAVAAAEAGKHVWLEKPAGRNAEETAEIADGRRAGRGPGGGRLQLPQRPGRRAGPAARGRRSARPGRAGRASRCSPTTPRTPRAR